MVFRSFQTMLETHIVINLNPCSLDLLVSLVKHAVNLARRFLLLLFSFSFVFTFRAAWLFLSFIRFILQVLTVCLMFNVNKIIVWYKHLVRSQQFLPSISFLPFSLSFDSFLSLLVYYSKPKSFAYTHKIFVYLFAFLARCCCWYSFLFFISLCRYACCCFASFRRDR